MDALKIEYKTLQEQAGTLRDELWDSITKRQAMEKDLELYYEIKDKKLDQSIDLLEQIERLRKELERVNEQLDEA